MNYFDGMNKALSYVEEHIKQDIDFQIVYKVAGMSKASFQRSFLMATDMTFVEYLRKRKLHYALQELQYTDQRIIDIGMTYGYDSASAFSRAIKNFTGKTPSEVRLSGSNVHFPKITFCIQLSEEEMKMNDKTIVRVEEHYNEKAVCFSVDCMDPEDKAWKLMSEWCKTNVSDRTARRFVGIAPKGHHPDGQEHQNASEHISHPYMAYMFLIGKECELESFHGLEVVDAPQGLYLVNDVALNQYDDNGELDMALSMMKASEAFVSFVKQTQGYDFDYAKGVFYEEHIFSEDWFIHGGFPDGFRMWVPVVKN